jgi:ribosomal protein L11 methyltransferase
VNFSFCFPLNERKAKTKFVFQYSNTPVLHYFIFPRPLPLKKRMDKAESLSAQTQHPGWVEISIEVHPVAQEAVSAFLFDLGCKGVVLGEKGKAFLRAYLPRTERFEELRSRIEVFLSRLAEFFPEAGQSSLHFSKIQDEDWSLTWRRHFHAERITGKLTVVPAWEPIPQALAGMVIRMDPGPAFGTGTHPTTRMCLESIENVHTPGAWTMLDIGTGSGILAVYAAKLGARRILAVDTDPEALRWAQRNVELNHSSAFIELSSKSVGELIGVFSILVANLTRDILLELLPDLQRLLEKDGTMILSGLLQEQVQEVKKPLGLLGFQQIQVVTQAEWACITAKRKE